MLAPPGTRRRVIPFSGPPSLPLVNRMTFALFVPLPPARPPSLARSPGVRGGGGGGSFQQNGIKKRCGNFAWPGHRVPRGAIMYWGGCACLSLPGQLTRVGVMIFPSSESSFVSLGRRMCPAFAAAGITDRSRRIGRGARLRLTTD